VGDYLTPSIYLSGDKTLLGVLMATSFVNPQGKTLVTVTLAATVLYVLPLVVVFFLAQQHILKGVVTSGLKG
jgi:multiple sugar transport system permease protein